MFTGTKGAVIPLHPETLHQKHNETKSCQRKMTHAQFEGKIGEHRAQNDAQLPHPPEWPTLKETHKCHTLHNTLERKSQKGAQVPHPKHHSKRQKKWSHTCHILQTFNMRLVRPGEDIPVLAKENHTPMAVVVIST